MIPVASAELCGDVGQQKPGVAAGNDDAVAPAVVKAADDAAPRRHLVDLIKKKPCRVFPGELSKCGKNGFHIFRRKIAQPVILEIQKKYFVPFGKTLLYQAGNHLIHDEGFPSSTGTDDGQDLRQIAQI